MPITLPAGRSSNQVGPRADLKTPATLDLKAAALLESLVRNHSLLDGDTRLGWLAVVVFYGLNGADLDAPDDEAYDLVIEVATEALTVEQIGERLLRWR